MWKLSFFGWLVLLQMWHIVIPSFIAFIYFLTTLFYIIISILKREKLNFNVVKIHKKILIIIPIITFIVMVIGLWIILNIHFDLWKQYKLWLLIDLFPILIITISSLYLACKLSKSNKIRKIL